MKASDSKALRRRIDFSDIPETSDEQLPTMRRWTYRVVKRTWSTEEVIFGIHEAYDDGDIERPHSISESPVTVVGESLDELKASHMRMMQAFERPVLDYAAFQKP